MLFLDTIIQSEMLFPDTITQNEMPFLDTIIQEQRYKPAFSIVNLSPAKINEN